MHLNPLGKLVREEWLTTAKLRANVRLGEFEVMPNHLHGIIVIVPCHAGEDGIPAIQRKTGDLPVAPTGPKKGSLGAILGNFRAAVTRRIRRLLNRPRFEVWQRDYYDHIIRDDEDWERIREYILENPKNWASDPENPSK